MRRYRAAVGSVAILLGLAPATSAQIPGVTAPTVPTVAAPATVPAAAAPAGGNIWSFFCKTPEQKAQCKAKFCNSSIGQFINNLLLPASAMTGGLIGPCCPNPLTTANPDDLLKPATSAQGAAAKIKAEEAQAKAKIAAIEYLATVDCRYYPEAEAGMITGLRAEKNECVRLAAAKALASGCCCTAKVVKALTMTVNCSNKDGFPAEASELVRIYAFVALERCLRKCVQAEPEAPPEAPPAVKQALYESLKPVGSFTNLDREILLAAYFAPTAADTHVRIFRDAHTALGKGLKVSPTTLTRLSGPRNLYDSVMPSGSQRRVEGEVVRMEPVTPLEAAPLAEPMPAQFREARPIGPAWLGTGPGELPSETEAPARGRGRGNLLHIFKDAIRR